MNQKKVPSCGVQSSGGGMGGGGLGELTFLDVVLDLQRPKFFL